MGASLNPLYANEAGRWSPSPEEMRVDRRDDDGPSRRYHRAGDSQSTTFVLAFDLGNSAKTLASP
jgi:hypothetical protein